MTEPEPLQLLNRTEVRQGRRQLAFFSGCDYFRLTRHPAVLKAVRSGMKQFGLSVSASRSTTGNHALYGELESALGAFFEAKDALVVSTGYSAPTVVAQALAGNFSHALIDESAHAALQDAVLHLDCPILRFKHRDPEALGAAVKRCGPGARLVVLTDGLFAYDGTVAPLRRYLKLLPADGIIVVDDAHGAGVLGRTGKGSLEVENVNRRRVIQCISLSKAFGAYGGAVLGDRRLRARMVRSRMFIGSTAIPLPLASAALTAIQILRRTPAMFARLNHNATQVKEASRDAGFSLPETPSPIVPIVLPNEAAIESLKQNLLAAGILPPFLRYPGSPPQGYFRFVISSEHSPAQLRALVKVLMQFQR
jgi:8-amino-7-oxononanoate synthase